MATLGESNKPKTSVVEARVDVRSLATLAVYFAENGELPTSKSRLISQCVEILAELLIQNNKAESFASTSEAIDALGRLGFFNLNRNKRNVSTLVKRLQLETLTEEGITTSTAQRTKSMVDMDAVMDRMESDEVQKHIQHLQNNTGTTHKQ